VARDEATFLELKLDRLDLTEVGRVS